MPDERKVRTVLLAEPDPGIIDLASEALTWGETQYQVIRETKGQAAYRAIQAFRPDVAVVAVDLPGMDGAEIVRTLSRLPIHRARPFIGLVDRGDSCAGRRMLESGCRDVLGRPFPARELRRRVSEALGEAAGASGKSGRVLVVCQDEEYRKEFARKVEQKAEIEVQCWGTVLEAVASTGGAAPRAVVIVAPGSVDANEPEPEIDCQLGCLRENGIAAPVLLIGDKMKVRADQPGFTWLPRRQALDEGPRILHLILREPENAAKWKWSAAVHDLAATAAAAGD